MKRTALWSLVLLCLGGCAASTPKSKPVPAVPPSPPTSASATSLSPPESVPSQQQAAPPPCQPLLQEEVFELPLTSGPSLHWAAGNEDAGQPCPLTLTKLKASCTSGSCARGQSGEHPVLVHWDGPIGSGQLWTITVWVKDVGGFCTYASTAGLRRLSGLRERWPRIEWLTDLDKDGNHELLLWASPFPSEDAGLGETILLPLPYVLEGNKLSLRLALARPLYTSLAQLYEQLAEAVGDDGRQDTLRLAEMMRSLASGACDQR